MKKPSQFPLEKRRQRARKYATKVHLDTTFETAIQVIVGKIKPTKDMLKTD